MKKCFALLLACVMCLAMAAPAFAAAPVFAQDFVIGATSVDHQAADKSGSYEPAMAFDGNLNTRVSINIDSAEGEYIIAELNDVYAVDGISIAWNNGHNRYYDVEVYVSVDGENWTVAAPRQNTALVAKNKDFAALPFTGVFAAKFIKLQCWGKVDIVDGIYDGAPGANGKVISWLTFFEMKINALNVAYEAGTAAIAKMSSLDYQDSAKDATYAPDKGADGNLNTRVSIIINSEAGEYIIAELAEVSTVSGLSISWNNGHSRFYDIEVSTSMDGKTWTVAANRGGTEVASGTKAFSDHNFAAPVQAKYIKIHCWGKTDTVDGIFDGAPKDGKAQSWLTFWEMKVNTLTTVAGAYDYPAADDAHSCEAEWAPVAEWVEESAWAEENAWVEESEWAEDDCWHIEEDNWF